MQGFNEEEEKVLNYLIDRGEIIRQPEFLPFSLFAGKNVEYELMYKLIKEFVFNGTKSVYGDWQATSMGFDAMIMQFSRTYNGDNIHYNTKLKRENNSTLYDKLYAYSPSATTFWHLVTAYKTATDARMISSKVLDKDAFSLAVDAAIEVDFMPHIQRETLYNIKCVNEGK